MLRTIVFIAIVAISFAFATARTSARAQPLDDIVAEPPTCTDGIVWHRSADIRFCATTCTSDIECASGERCRVLDQQRKPEEGTLYADDIQEELLAAHEEVALADAEPQFAEPRVCEGECAPYTGDLLCDPFHDIAGAMLSAANQAPASAQAGTVA